MFFDPTYMLLIPALIFAFWAQWKVQHAYRKFSRVPASNGHTGREIAAAIMQRNGISDVGITEVGGTLSDHYDPRSKTVALSSSNFRDSSIASIAVAAHEVGHVLQHHRVGPYSRATPYRYVSNHLRARADEYSISKDGRSPSVFPYDNAAFNPDVAAAAHTRIDDHTYWMNDHESRPEIRA